jgi:hypothetical protein
MSPPRRGAKWRSRHPRAHRCGSRRCLAHQRRGKAGAFLKRELAPGKLRAATRHGLKDHNKDGSIDWKDLTVHSERIYQLRDTDNDGTADKMTVFAEGFNSVVTGIAAGILYHDGWVYVTVAPDLCASATRMTTASPTSARSWRRASACTSRMPGTTCTARASARTAASTGASVTKA